ncbi:oligosaccharide flippase family protein [Thioclava electrotropha]|uniref:Oligosaccharide flippase family protein n=1 Tax=Thioclava electrotropha TaxID=1549850 RepID=A0ABX6YQC2_9RHOB|nr:oligosaccharide flippase family protein [Thioclava electrotropha]QPZ90009.1 oligosaccharide flippase family protein [Thioclava electrotropha]
MKLYEKLQVPILRDALGIGLVKLLAIPAALAVAIILARTLGPSDYGIYAFALSLTNLFALLLTGGLAQLVTREVAFALHGEERSLLKGVIEVATGWGLSSSVLAIFIAWITLTFFFPEIEETRRVVLLTGFLALPILALSPVWAGTLRGYGLGAKSQFPGLLLMPLTQLATVSVLLWVDWLTAQTAMLAFAFANGVVAVVGLSLMRRTISGALRNTVAQYRLATWAKSSVTFTGIAMIMYVSTQVGVLLLGFVSSSADVGAYQIADRGAQLVILPTAIIELVLAPHVARHFKAGEEDRMRRLFRISRLASGGMTLFLALPMVFMGAPIIRVAFGEDYVGMAVHPLAIISSALVVRALLGPTTTFLSMTGNERSTLAAQGLALVVNVILTLILAPRLGATGAAIASATGILLWSGLLGIQTWRKLGIRVLWPFGY